MTRRRTIIFIVGSLVAFAGVPSEPALASSLLSGYGGPGQGSQVLLGSALLNGPGGGGSGASAGSTSAAATASGSGTQLGAGRQARSHGHSDTARGSHAAASTPRLTAPPSIAEVYNAAERGASAPSTGTLGLSGSDLVLIALALGALAMMAVLTRRLTRLPAPAGRRREGSGS
jgi:hypothetical protein